MMRTKWLQATVIATVLLALVSHAAAQVLAGRTLKILVAFPAGTTMDLVARSFSTELATALGANAIVENRGGAGGSIGTAMAAKVAPDGQTLLFTSGSHTINGSLYTKLPYHPIKDFAGVAFVGTTGYQLLSSAAVPAKTTGELIAYAKANPGKLNFSSAGMGSAGHLSMAYFARLAGIEIVHVPMKGMAAAAGEVVAGRAHMMIYAGGTQYAKEPRVHLLGVTTPRRAKSLPDVPTVSESGLPGFEFASWYGLLVPAATPRDVIVRINTEVNKVVKEPLIMERFAKYNAEPANLSMSPEEFDKLLRSDFENMAKIVAISGAKVE